ncbi:MAG: OFA family MFS transporter [Firmicutes bacterium]|nr:OFA family MFS transporter [Bacillota bacterium]
MVTEGKNKPLAQGQDSCNGIINADFGTESGGKPLIQGQNDRDDSRARKIISIIACLLVQLCVGILYIWSIFKSQIHYYYDWPEKNADLVSSIMMFGFVSGNLIGGFLHDKTNPKLIATVGCAIFSGGILLTSLLTARTISLIYITYGIIAGVGCGFVYGSILNCLQRWFPNRKGFATGLSVAAFGLSTVAFAPLSQFLLDKFKAADRPPNQVNGELIQISDVPKVFLILGLTFALVSLVSCIFIFLPKARSAKGGAEASAKSKSEYKKNLPGLSPLQILKKSAFWCIFFSCFCINGLWNIMIPLIKPLGINRGLDVTWAALAVTFTGVANVLGRFGMGSLADKIGRAPTIVLNTVITLICAVALIWAGVFVYLAAVVLAAFSYGGVAATFPTMTLDVGGPKYAGTNYGMALFALGFSSVGFNYASIALVEATGGMTASFILAACAAAVPIVLMAVYSRTRKKSANNFNQVSRA